MRQTTAWLCCFIAGITIFSTTCTKSKSASDNSASSPQNQADQAEPILPYNASYNLYVNPRFEFRILVPRNMVSDPPPENGDGLTFHSPDRKIELKAWGGYNALQYSTEQQMEEYIDVFKSYKIAYKTCDPSQFVLSGTGNGMILYLKSLYIRGDDKFLTFTITYPESMKKEYDKTIGDISVSFREVTDPRRTSQGGTDR